VILLVITKELELTCRSTVELKSLKLDTQIGTYGPSDVVPDEHLLDLTLWINTDLVLIAKDGMDYVFDYDPLLVDIERLARDGHYQTQERVITRIASACAAYPQIDSAEIALRKSSVRAGSSTLGVRLFVDHETLAGLRRDKR
jgi:dihydroneopterin aldolase